MENFEVFLENKEFVDFIPISFGYAACKPNQTLDLSARRYTLIHYVVSGKGTLELGGNLFRVNPGEIFIIPKHTVNHYQADAHDPWTYMWIAFTGKLSADFSQLPPIMIFQSNLFYDMMKVKKINIMREEFVTSKLFELYRFLFSKDASPNYVSAVQNFIDYNYMRADLSIENIAHSLNLNRSYLTRLFKKTIGISIQDYLIQVRMQHATTLLQTGTSVQNTAYLVGYTDVFNFSKMFKKKFGVAPKIYVTK